MADSRQFGSPKAPHFGSQFGDKPTGNQPADPTHCAQCEAMLADALDHTLSQADQAIFDAHMAHCGPCAQMLADARRGAAWLEMLRDPRPEPPAELLERILAQTSGATAVMPTQLTGAALTPTPAYVSSAPLGLGYTPASSPAFGKVIPFRTRLRSGTFGHILFQPRLAMTAAMAFFSIALTLDLTGVRLQDLRASDLRPGSIKRDFTSANARVVRYYEGLRVVYELESRVHDLQSSSDNDAPAGTHTAPSPGPSSGQTPANQPGPANQKTAPKPEDAQPEPKKPAPSPGTSRREDLYQSRRLVAETLDDKSFRNTFTALERAQA